MDVLEKETPAGYASVDRLVSKLTEAAPRITAREARSAVQAILSVESGRVIHDDSLEKFAQGIATSRDLDLPPDTAGLLTERLEVLARLPVIAITAKTKDIASEHDRIFHSARVLTDIRPVFGDDPHQPPLGAVVSHLLRIDVFRHGKLEDYFVALDNSDLVALKAVVDRAIEKNQSLGKILDVSGFARFDLAEEE